MLFIDSFSDKALELLKTGFFSGLTTNPSILKRDRPGMGFKDVILFLNTIPGLHFVQGSMENLKWLEWLREVVKEKKVNPEKFVIKLPWEPIRCFNLINDVRDLGFKICATAVYSLNQYYLAEISKVDYVAIYFDRMRRTYMNPFKLIHDILKIRVTDLNTPRIIVASIKNVEDANNLLIAGVNDLTLPLDVSIEFLKATFPLNDLEKFEKDFKF